MKSTGVVRKVDELGRIVIPKELRRTLQVEEKTPLEIFVEDEKIILKKYKASKECAITGEISDDNREFANGLVLSPRGIELLKQDLEKVVQ
ncbi:AbrB/MazE/SpoVT family DNA-binding domain-containing protein [Halobacillus shinanisalinarum]|uniref:AbrB/MazE/SpoVT family DNA-binding domain-containing protein n=1 Tax=Halobacillus shinanisalinarum TaxID=2932258 RepID=A0ABY4H2E3_9BACI|nr:AbrB/MazE/SpoVT family DNA-binding domain-containing protein [Halobacillus shinanisalinarum]UOQ94474.1 AbrB/MazE/SpoVT family DNA-binding domain-containing protein [Halobacillus shinanisalinarum]